MKVDENHLLYAALTRKNDNIGYTVKSKVYVELSVSLSV